VLCTRVTGVVLSALSGKQPLLPALLSVVMFPGCAKDGDVGRALLYWVTCCCQSPRVDVAGSSHAVAGGRCATVVDSTCAEAAGLIHSVQPGHGGAPVDGHDS